MGNFFETINPFRGSPKESVGATVGVLKPDIKITNERLPAEEKVLKLLRQGYFSDADVMAHEKKIPAYYISTATHFRSAAEEGARHMLEEARLQRARDAAKRFDFELKVDDIERGILQAFKLGQSVEVYHFFNGQFPDWIYERPQIVAAAKKAFIQALQKDLYYRDIPKNFPFTPAMLEAPEVQEAIEKSMKKDLANGRVPDACYKATEYRVSIEKRSNSLIQQLALEGVKKMNSLGSFIELQSVMKAFCLSPAQAKQLRDAGRKIFVDKNGFVDHLFYGLQDLSVEKLDMVKADYGLSDAMFLEPRMQAAAEKSMKTRLRSGSIWRAARIAQIYHVEDRRVRSLDMKKRVQQAMIDCLSRGDIPQSQKEFTEVFQIPAEFFKSAEYAKAAEEGALWFLQKADSDRRDPISAVNFLDTCKMPEVIHSERIQAAIQKFIFNVTQEQLSRSGFTLMTILHRFKVSETFIASLEARKKAEKKALEAFSKGYGANAIEFMNAFFLTEDFKASPEVAVAAKNGLLRKIKEFAISGQGGDVRNFVSLLVFFPAVMLQEPDIQKAVKEALLKRVSYGDNEGIACIFDVLKPSEDVLRSPEVQEMVTNTELLKTIRFRDVAAVVALIDRFRLSPEVLRAPAIWVAGEQKLKQLETDHQDEQARTLKKALGLTGRPAKSAYRV